MGGFAGDDPIVEQLEHGLGRLILAIGVQVVHSTADFRVTIGRPFHAAVGPLNLFGGLGDGVMRPTLDHRGQTEREHAWLRQRAAVEGIGGRSIVGFGLRGGGHQPGDEKQAKAGAIATGGYCHKLGGFEDG